MSHLRNTDHGHITIIDPGSDKPLEVHKMVKCVHCGGQFILKPPKLIKETLTPLEAEARIREGKTVRGWCQNCAGYICGPGCVACVNEEQLLENIEKGRPMDYKPIIVPTSFSSTD